MAKKIKTKQWDRKIWLDAPEAHDYPACQDYLELLFRPNICAEIVKKLKKAPVIQKKAKDILRASKLKKLTEKNIHVKENIKKIDDGKKLSPVLLVCVNGKLIVADGYHRISTCYVMTEDFIIPCKLVYYNT